MKPKPGDTPVPVVKVKGKPSSEQSFPESAAQELLKGNPALKPLIDLARWTVSADPSNICAYATAATSTQTAAEALQQLHKAQDRIRLLVREVFRVQSVTFLVPAHLSTFLDNCISSMRNGGGIEYANLRVVQRLSNEFYNALVPFFNAPQCPKMSTVMFLLIEVLQLVLSRYTTVRNLLLDDVVERAAPIPNSYNPPQTGQALYFRSDGLRVRTKRRVQGLDEGKDVDDDADPEGEGTCSKTYAASKGHSYMMFWLCPLHGHCWGFSTIHGNEGRKDVHEVLYEYLDEAPKTVFYDFACRCAHSFYTI